MHSRRAVCQFAAIIDMLGFAGTGLALGVSEWEGIAPPPPDPTPTLLAPDIAGALQANMVAAILTFLMSNPFDMTGTLIGVAHQAQLLDQGGRLRDMQRADQRFDENNGRRPARYPPVTSYSESATASAVV